MLIDTHCHLDFSQFDEDRESVIRRAIDNKVEYLIDVGASIESSCSAQKLASRYDNIFFTVGVHPHYADSFSDVDLARLQELIQNSNPVAIGEIGLDYYRDLSDRKKQRIVFEKLIALSKDKTLPLVVHCRESHVDMYDILKDIFSDFKQIVFHCFAGPMEFLEKCLSKNAMFSFTANITYPKAQDLREMIGVIPLENIMLETDSPYLSPQKLRGKRNEPSYVQYVAQEVARIKNYDVEQVALATTANAKSFFKLPI